MTCTSTSKGWSTPIEREPPLSLFSMCENWRYSKIENKSRESSISLYYFISLFGQNAQWLYLMFTVTVKKTRSCRVLIPFLRLFLFYHRQLHLFWNLTLCYFILLYYRLYQCATIEFYWWQQARLLCLIKAETEKITILRMISKRSVMSTNIVFVRATSTRCIECFHTCSGESA